ncbi:acyloxyacyl hydrolase [Burkholderia gladioli]|uniref:acyloxyacyl hydrolase n=1 Tax=Burkholderia gladioli TaxID=28095 RepID=UPI001364BFBE|nr:acyloxyacyl hydrolase [Burkholderia gladioli]KAF1063223.1 Lipid A deacylase PagL [Burkholderia gladioli]WAG19461.1 acyloxyacyl hydrolase [Burkholderia gladioli]
MQNKKSLRAGRWLAGTVLAATLAGGSNAAFADRWGVQLAGGIADHDMKKVDLGVVWDPGWSWWQMGDWHFTFVMEGHASYWHYGGDHAVNANIGEFGVTPVFRFIKRSGAIRPFFEAGVGLRLLTHPTIATNYTMSTAFQFADMVGIGAQFGGHQQYQAGFRFQHESNASIKDPNPGINFSQIYVQYNF